MKKRSLKKPRKLKKAKIINTPEDQEQQEEDRLMEALNSNISIYETHIKNENYEDKDELQVEDPYENYNEEEDRSTMENTSFYEKNCQQTLHETPNSQTNDTIEQSLTVVQQQLKQQNLLMNHLLQVSTNMALLMERHLKAEERKTLLMERQLRQTESHNLYLRRQELRRKSKFKNRNGD